MSLDAESMNLPEDELEAHAKRICEWSPADPMGLMVYLKNIWWAANWGWREEDAVCDVTAKPVRRFVVSTGGWSDNERLLEAFQDNWLCWSQAWVSSRRGGHYVFEVRRP